MKKENEEATIKCVVYLTETQNEKVELMSKKLKASKQECIRRIIDEGQLVDLQMEINMDSEFIKLSNEISEMNKKLQGIYATCSRTSGNLTEFEKKKLFSQLDEINTNTGEMLASIWKTNNNIESKAMTQLKNLINKSKSRKGGGSNGDS